MSPPSATHFEPNVLWRDAIEPIFWLDPALKLSYVNRAWEQLTGVPAETVIGLTCEHRAPTRPGDMSDLAASFRPPPEAVAGEPSGTRALIIHADGRSIWRRLEFWPFRGLDQSLIGLLGLARPVDCEPSVPDTRLNAAHVGLLDARRRLQHQFGFENLIGFGPAHNRLMEQVRIAAAAAAAPILVVGETGTGKRHVVRTIHHTGPNRHRPLIPFDCEALPPELLERELLAARPSSPCEVDGAAVADQAAHHGISAAEGSTFMLREITKLPRDIQARLTESLDGRVRLLATSAVDPETARKNDLLRPELYFALSTLVLRLQPLRERLDELPILAQHLLERANERVAKTCHGFSAQALGALMTYDWPGNMSELARVIDHATDQHRGESGLIAVDDLPSSIQGNLGASYAPPISGHSIKPLDELLMDVERRLIETALHQSRGNKSRSAEMLGISRPRLYRRIKELNLPDDAESPDDGETAQ